MELNDRFQYFHIYKSNCFKCNHFDPIEYICTAFPIEIPLEIADGENKHTEPLEGQENNIVFEKLKTEN